MLFDFANIFIFLVAGIVFILLNILISSVAQTRLFTQEKSIAYRGHTYQVQYSFLRHCTDFFDF